MCFPRNPGWPQPSCCLLEYWCSWYLVLLRQVGITSSSYRFLGRYITIRQKGHVYNNEAQSTNNKPESLSLHINAKSPFGVTSKYVKSKMSASSAEVVVTTPSLLSLSLESSTAASVVVEVLLESESSLVSLDISIVVVLEGSNFCVM